MNGLVPGELEFSLSGTATDFTSQLSDPEILGTPIGFGSFSEVFGCIVKTSNGEEKVAVKVFKIDPSRDTGKIQNAIRRELKVWLRLKNTTIVPLLGFACVEYKSKFPALVSQWMPFGTLFVYLTKATITAFAKVALVKGVASGLDYLQSVDVVHGDLHPGNVLIDGSGNPCLTDFGLATIEGEVDMQLTSTTVQRSFDSRWRAPEVLGVESECNPQKPTFMSDIYSFGGVMFFKKHVQICVALSNKVIRARPENILDDHWNLIQKCWSWEASHRPRVTKVLQYIDQFRTDNWQGQQPKVPTGQGLVDLTGQIVGTNAEFVDFGMVFKCKWRRPTGPMKVAVKVSRHHHIGRAPEQDLRRFRRETAIWAHLVHDNIVTLYGTTEGFGPTTALVSQWFPDGTLSLLIIEQGTTLTIESKLKLLHGIASGLHYLHSFPVVYGVITSKCQIQESIVRPGAIRWAAPELFRSRDSPSDKPTTQNDMYSVGRVMFYLLTLIVPWHNIDEYEVLQKIQNGEDVSRPEIFEAMSDVTDARWNYIEQCWSIDPSARPCALTSMNFVTGELETLKQDVDTMQTVDAMQAADVMQAVYDGLPPDFFNVTDGAMLMWIIISSRTYGNYYPSPPPSRRPRSLAPSSGSASVLLGQLSSTFRRSHRADTNNSTELQRRQRRSILFRGPRIVEVAAVREREVFMSSRAFPIGVG
ncbi:kinase-like domain-containing protein [Suillus plorans]|uniref:Kinase-like domain-containing protein n=1 Tax=Suillus plorans TaxID=116603 RepID=A0A9P7DPD6_9AGAM|nr:kinase-like domain-containing protein [Suillus plorans]KAG1799820.1 kinase-like domain-containing protein [Suillus plorans]